MKNCLKTTSWLPAFIAGIGLAAMPAMANAQTVINIADDHFLCYKGKITKGQTSAAGTSVHIDDMLAQPADFEIKKERGSCNPADKNGEGIVDAVTHLTAYQIKRDKLATKFAKATNIRMVDQFGELFLDTKKEDRLLIPASKDDNPANPLPDPPIAANHNVDHYKCYKASESKGSTKFAPQMVAVEDQWETPAKQYELKKPKLLCFAADKNGEGIKNMDANVICYQAKPAKGEPKHVKREEVGFGDQLIQHRLDSKKEELLCVPALKDPPAEYCGDGIINDGGLEDCEGDDASPCIAGQACIGCKCVSPSYCGDGVIDAGETCEANADCATGETCTSGCGCVDSQCPGLVHWTRFSKAGVMGPLDSDYDSGWTGFAHNSGIPDQAELPLTVSSYSGTAPACGVATIAGLDPAGRMCRCANDNRAICDAPLVNDIDDCGGDECVCYYDPPISTITQNVQTCSLTRLSANISGTWNVDTGEGDVLIPVDQSTRFGALLLAPCPTCDGDITPNDGVRDGACSGACADTVTPCTSNSDCATGEACLGGGADAGLPCDAQYVDPTFPVTSPGANSLDCFPAGATVAQGIVADHMLTTGSTGLGSLVPCSVGGALDCHCGVCQTDQTIPCSSDANCPTGDVCGDFQPGVNPLPNPCDDIFCTENAGDPGQGSCLADSPVTYCDGVLRAEGTGLLNCTTNADCVPPAKTINAGNCLLEEQPRCYPASFSLTGTPSPTAPYVVSAVCQAPSNSPSANFVAGYPGPGVRQEQLNVTLPCAGNPGSSYPGCP